MISAVPWKINNLHCSWICLMTLLEEFFPAKLSQHCAVDTFAAVIPQSKHNFSLVHASYCRSVCGHESESLWSRWTHTLATVYATGQHWESSRSSVSSSSCSQAPVSDPVFSFLHVSVDVKHENWSTVQQWNPLQKQLRTQKRQQVNIQHIKTPRYSF